MAAVRAIELADPTGADDALRSALHQRRVVHGLRTRTSHAPGKPDGLSSRRVANWLATAHVSIRADAGPSRCARDHRLDDGRAGVRMDRWTRSPRLDARTGRTAPRCPADPPHPRASTLGWICVCGDASCDSASRNRTRTLVGAATTAGVARKMHAMRLRTTAVSRCAMPGMRFGQGRSCCCSCRAGCLTTAGNQSRLSLPCSGQGIYSVLTVYHLP